MNVPQLRLANCHIWARWMKHKHPDSWVARTRSRRINRFGRRGWHDHSIWSPDGKTWYEYVPRWTAYDTPVPAIVHWGMPPILFHGVARVAEPPYTFAQGE